MQVAETQIRRRKRTEAVTEATHECRRSPCRIPPDGEEGCEGARSRRQRDGDVEGGDRAEQRRDRRQQHAERQDRGVGEQVDPTRSIEGVREERVLAPLDGVQRPCEPPHILRRIRRSSRQRHRRPTRPCVPPDDHPERQVDQGHEQPTRRSFAGRLGLRRADHRTRFGLGGRQARRLVRDHLALRPAATPPARPRRRRRRPPRRGHGSRRGP